MSTPGCARARHDEALRARRQRDGRLAGHRRTRRGEGQVAGGLRPQAGRDRAGRLEAERLDALGGPPAQHPAQVDLAHRGRREGDLLDARRRELALLADQLERDADLAVAGVGEGEGPVGGGGAHPDDVRRRGGRGLRRAATRGRAGRGRRGRARRPRWRPAVRGTRATCTARASRLGVTSERSKEVDPSTGHPDAAQGGDVDQAAAVPHRHVGDGRALVGVDEGQRGGVLRRRAHAGEPALGVGLLAAHGRAGAGPGHHEAGGQVGGAVDDDVLAFAARRDAGVEGLGVVLAPDPQRRRHPRRDRCCRSAGRRRPAAGPGTPRSCGRAVRRWVRAWSGRRRQDGRARGPRR